MGAKCYKCQKELEKGLAGSYNLYCSCGAINLQVKEYSGEIIQNNSLDYSKLSNHNIESMALKGGAEEHKVKAVGFTKMADEVSSLMRNATTQTDYDRYKNFLNKTVLPLYKKYNH